MQYYDAQGNPIPFYPPPPPVPNPPPQNPRIEMSQFIQTDDGVMFGSLVQSYAIQGYVPVGSPVIFAKNHSNEQGNLQRFNLLMVKYVQQY